MLSLEFVRGFDMSSALKKRKINKNLNKKLKLSLHDQTSYDIKFRYNKLQKKDRKFKRNILALLFLSFVFMGFISLHNYIKLNNRIKELRKQKKITQDELAKAVEVTRQTIISLENGKYNASLQLAYKISRYFGTNIEDVFIFEEE